MKPLKVQGKVQKRPGEVREPNGLRAIAYNQQEFMNPLKVQGKVQERPGKVREPNGLRTIASSQVRKPFESR